MDKLKLNSINIIVGRNSSGKTTILNKIMDNPGDYFDKDEYTKNGEFDIKNFYSINVRNIFEENNLNGHLVKGTKEDVDGDIKNISDLKEINQKLFIKEIKDLELFVRNYNNESAIPSTGIDKYFHIEYILWDIKNKIITRFLEYLKKDFIPKLSLDLLKLGFDFNEYSSFLNSFKNFSEPSLLPEIASDISEQNLDSEAKENMSWEAIMEFNENDEVITEEQIEINNEIIDGIKKWSKNINNKLNSGLNSLKSQSKFILSFLDLASGFFINDLNSFLKNDNSFDIYQFICEKTEINRLKEIQLFEINEKLEKISKELFIDEENKFLINILFSIDEIEKSLDNSRINNLIDTFKKLNSESNIINFTFVISTHSPFVIKRLAHFEKSNIFISSFLKDESSPKLNYVDDDLSCKIALFQGNNPEILFNNKIIIVEGLTDIYFLDYLCQRNAINIDGYTLAYSNGIKNMQFFSKFFSKYTEHYKDIIFIIDDDVNNNMNFEKEEKSYPYYGNFNDNNKTTNNKKSLRKLHDSSEDSKGKQKILTHLYKGFESYIQHEILQDSNIKIEKRFAFDFSKLDEILGRKISSISSQNIKDILYRKINNHLFSRKEDNFSKQKSFTLGDKKYFYYINFNEDGNNEVFGPHLIK